MLSAESYRLTLSLTFTLTLSQAEQSSLQAKIAELESAAAKTCESQVALRMPYDSCPGSDLVDTCWFKVGILEGLSLRTIQRVSSGLVIVGWLLQHGYKYSHLVLRSSASLHRTGACVARRVLFYFII